MGKSKKYKQHYVPQSILRNFTTNKKNKQVFCLMKDQQGKIIQNSVSNLCCEKDFYSFSLDSEDEKTGESLNYDKHIFDELDGDIATITKKLIKNNKVELLTNEDKENIAKYITYQYFRSLAVNTVAESLCQDQTKAKQVMGLNLLDVDFIEKVANILRKLKLTLLRSDHKLSIYYFGFSCLILSSGRYIFSHTSKLLSLVS